MRRMMIAGVATMLALAACTTTGGDTTVATAPPTTAASGAGAGVTGSGSGGITAIAEAFDPSTVRFEAALQRFDRCESFLDYIKAEALERVGPYGLDGGSFGGPVPFAAVEEFAADGGGDVAATTAVAAAEAPVAGVDFSETNVQVAGVDEPDIVKTDGRRIVALVDNTLHHVDVSGDEPRLTDSLFLGDGYHDRLFLAGDRAFVLGQGGGFFPVEPLAEAASTIFPDPGGPMVSISQVDLSDPEDLRLVRTMTVSGGFVAARGIDGTARVVISSFPASLAFVYPSGPAAEETALEANRRVIEESTLETWLPSYLLTEGEQILSQGVLADCARIHRPAEFGGFEMLSVLTFDLEGPLEQRSVTTVTARGETVYSSADSLYVATSVWVPNEIASLTVPPDFEERWSTAIHKFDIGGDGPAEYAASGSVEGHLLNQFSLNEHEGLLQVATTVGTPWGFRDDAESFVSVFRQEGDRLQLVGSVGDLGRGERIFAARFIGDTAYVVTFRQVDPFYVVDLSDPAAPAVTGELKIPGFSAYLHPIDGDRVLGVGQDATEEGFTTGAKVSLFDVSDPANPREVDTWVLAEGFSEVEWDHRAFLYWAPEQEAVLPVQNYAADFFGAVVLKTDDGLREFGRVEHQPIEGTLGTSDCRQLSPDDLGLSPAEFGDVLVQICGPEDSGGATGHFCEVLPAGELGFIAEELLGETGVDLGELVGPDDRLEYCWPDFDNRRPILRSLVVGGDLWTLSRQSLQANSLTDLAVRHLVPLV